MDIIKKTAKAGAMVMLLGAGTATMANTSAVAEAATKYSIKTVKKAYIYTSKGKKTKKFYKKNTSLKAYGTKWIKGKKYYKLGHGRYIRTANAKKPAKYSYSVQTKKITRMIKMYQPKGVKTVKQNAYIKRSVKTNLKTHKKTYGKWSTSSWKKYKVATVKGYKASRASVGAAKVTYKRKNQTIKITYKLVKKTAPKKTSKPAEKPATTPSKPTNSGKASSSNKNTGASTQAKPVTKPSQPTNSGSTNNGGMAAQYKLEVKDATITPDTSYNGTAFKVKHEGTGKSASSDVIKSVSADGKTPFKVSFGLEYGVYNLKASPAVGQSGTYNLPVTVTYTDGSKETVTIKITVPTLNYWTDATKASARSKLLDEINSFRSAVGVSPATLVSTPEYQAFMDQRAAEKAKQLADTGMFNHSGQTLQDKFDSIHAGENIGVIDVDAGDSLDAQVNRLLEYYKNAIQEEKDDYEAIAIRHERTNITNISGTVGHYTNIIIPSATKVVIGIGTYSKNGNTFAAVVTSHITSMR